MKISVITICKNEEVMLPHFLDHYRDLADSIHVFDNGSKDGTHALLDAEPKVRRIHFDTFGYQKEEINTLIRNSAYRQLRIDADWFFMVDIDELLWHPDLRGYLERCLSEGITLPRVRGYNLFSETPPERTSGRPITEQISEGVPSSAFNKFSIVHKSVEVNYGYGSHMAEPKGNVRPSDRAEVRLLHYNVSHLGFDEDLVKRKRTYILSPKTNELIPRGPTKQYRRVIELEENLAIKLPVHDGPFGERLKELQAAADQKDHQAMHIIGMALFHGHILRENREASLSWFQNAASGDLPLSHYQLAHMYYLGEGTERNIALALRHFLAGAKLGHARSQFNAGQIFMMGHDVITIDEEQGLYWLKQAAEQDHAEAYFHLSVYYTKRDQELCNTYRRRGAELEELNCMYNEGAYHYNQQNFQEAFRWLHKASQSGAKDVQEPMEHLFKHGKGIPDDFEGSAAWFQEKLRHTIGPI